jgi:hypothetical protein
MTIDNNGIWHVWSYIAQYIASGAGKSIKNGVNYNNSFVGQWRRVELEVQLNTAAGVRDGHLKGFVDNGSVINVSGLEIRESTDMWARGFGIYNQHRNVNTVGGEKFHFRNFKIYGRP